MTVQKSFPECHLKTINTQKGISMETIHDRRLTKMSVTKQRTYNYPGKDWDKIDK